MLTTPITFFDTPTAPGPIGTPSSLGSSVSSGITGSSDGHVCSGAITEGNLVVVAVTLNSNEAVTATAVSDGTNTYTEVTSILQSFTDVSLWYKENADGVGGTPTITVTFSGAMTSGGACRISAGQVSGVITSSSLDKFDADSVANATSVTSTTGVLAQANEIIFGAQGSLTGTSYSGASGFTTLAGAMTTLPGHLDYQIVAATTSVNYTPTMGASALQLCSNVGTFKGNP